jgi:hypothetical protein
LIYDTTLDQFFTMNVAGDTKVGITIGTAGITDANITAAKLAADVIDETKIADNGIDSEHYNNGSIDSEHLEGTLPDGADLAAATQAGDGDRTIADKAYVDSHHEAAKIKGWAKVLGSNGSDQGSYNVSSTSRTSQGLFVVNWDTDFAAQFANVCVVATVNHTDAAIPYVSAQAVGSVSITVRTHAGALVDPGYLNVMAIGTQ